MFRFCGSFLQSFQGLSLFNFDSVLRILGPKKSIPDVGENHAETPTSGRCQQGLLYLDVLLEVEINGDRIHGSISPQYIPFISRLQLTQLIRSPLIPSKVEWDLTNGPCSVSCDRAIRYSGEKGSVDRGSCWRFLGLILTNPSQDIQGMTCLETNKKRRKNSKIDRSPASVLAAWQVGQVSV